MANTIVFDIETISGFEADAVAHMATKRDQEPAAFAALCPVLCQVIAVGMQCGDRERCLVVGRDAETEEELLAEVNATLAKASGIVTFNGRGFDVPVLIHRSRIAGVQPAEILLRSAWQKPWEDRPHTDVLDLMTFGGAGQRYSLEAYAIGYGFENPKSAGVDGSKVGEMYEAGRLDEIAEYCLRDVRTTARLLEVAR